MAVSPKDVEKFLRGVDYPVTKDDLINHVKKQQALLPRVLDALEKLPEQTFNRPVDVSKAIGEIDRSLKSSS